MTPAQERILALALQAVTDETARVVLADLIEESGWRTPDVPFTRAFVPSGLSMWLRDVERSFSHLTIADSLASNHARAIAAVLLFADWYNPDVTIAHAFEVPELDDDAEGYDLRGFPDPSEAEPWFPATKRWTADEWRTLMWMRGLDVNEVANSLLYPYRSRR